MYSAHIIAIPDDPDGYRRAARCFLSSGPTALAVVFACAADQLAPGDDTTRRIIDTHGRAASDMQLRQWVDRSADETVLLALLYAFKTAQRTDLDGFRNERARVTRYIQSLVGDCSDPLFREELRAVHAVSRAEERGGGLIDQVARNGLTPAPARDRTLSGPRRVKPAKVRLWTGKGGKRS